MQTPANIRGVTLIELMIVIVIAAILLSIAVPAFQNTIDKNRLKAATESMYSSIQFAKTESIKRNRPIRVNFTTSGGGTTWCYGLKENADCDCTITDATDAEYCEVNGVKQITLGSDFPGVSATASADFSFNNIRGTVNAGNITLNSGKGKQTKVIINGLGRIRICSTAGDANVPDYTTCP